MEDIPPSPVESGFLTRDPSSYWPTPQGTFESVYTDDGDEELNYTWDNTRKPYRDKLHTSSVTNLDEEPEDIPTGQIHYPSAPDISESMRRRNEQNHPEMNDAGARREAPQEQQLLPDISGETGDNGEKKKKSFCHSSLNIPVWLIVLVIVIVILVAVLLGCLLSRVAVKDLSSCGPPCEKSWIWVGGRCYYFSNTSNTWNDSRDVCTKNNSMLAVLIDQEIKKTIERYKENSEYWIGLSMNHNGQWMWINGSLYNASMDNHDDGRLRCAFLNSHLGALDCSTGRQWICVKDSMY